MQILVKNTFNSDTFIFNYIEHPITMLDVLIVGDFIYINENRLECKRRWQDYMFDKSDQEGLFINKYASYYKYRIENNTIKVCRHAYNTMKFFQDLNSVNF